MNKKYICILIYSIFSLLFSGAGSFLSAEPNIAPEQEIIIDEKKESSEKPSWKSLWDKARLQIRDNRLEDAKVTYETLVALKPNIVAASWEYCKLLVTLGEWEDAAHVVEGLLDYEPENLQFLLTAGRIALENKRFNKATQYFGQVFESDPVGPFSNEAILGLVKGLTGIESKKGALVLLEQYYQRGNTEDSVVVELARLSKELGLYRQALYYYSILTKRNPQNTDYLHQNAELSELVGDIDTAALFWLKYLELEPDFLSFHKKIAKYFIDRDNVSKALFHLKKVYQLEHPSPELALQIADLYYEKQQRGDKALLYYEQYLKTAPDDVNVAKRVDKIRSALALDYLPIVEGGAVDILWRDLGYITSDKAKIFLLIADLLKAQKKSEIELSVVETLFEHSNRNDLDLAYRLAGLHQETGDKDVARKLYLLLDKRGYYDKKYLIAKAENELGMNNELLGFNTYLKYLAISPENTEVIEKALMLGGNLGLADEVVELWEKVPDPVKTSPSSLQLKLKYIEALYKCGFYTRANKIYAEILQERENDKKSVVEIYYHLVDSFIQRGFNFRAEQLLRQNLARGMDADRAIRKLVRLSIEQKRFDDARSWLELLARRHGIEDIDDKPEELPQDLHFLLLELLIAEQEYDDAEDQVIDHRRYTGSIKERTEFNLQSDRYLVRIFFFQEEYEECLAKIQELGTEDSAKNELYVIDHIIQSTRLENAGGLNSGKTGSEVVAFTAHIDRAKWFTSYGRESEALTEIIKAQQQVPQSMVAMMRKVETLAAMSRFKEALDVVGNLVEINPQEEYFNTLQLQLQFQRGEFDTIVKNIPIKEKETPETADTEGIHNGHDIYFWKRLLLARALWAENRRAEAIEVYNSLLAVPVDSMFLEKVEVEKINFKLPPLKKSFWNIITFTTPERPDPITTVMEPQFVAQNIGQPIDNLAAGLYGKYRWQELIKKELSARKAVEKRDYYHAEKEYLSLLEEEKSQESLFDLANIYHKLGLYGKAAELYELMKEKGPLYPGLDEYIQANLLKRQPRLTFSMLADSRKGREGYVNKRKRSYGFETWIMPTNDQEVSLQAYHNVYRSRSDDERFRRQRVLGAYSTYFENTTDLNIHFGVDSPADPGTTEFLYKFELIHRINKLLEMYGRFEQDLVEDTLRSVTDSVIYKDFEAGMKYDLFPRWFVGADFRYRIYSDDNSQERYKLWSQYHLFGEVNQFKVKYSYEYLRNDEGNVGRQNDFSNIFAEGDSVYWSPAKYWQQKLNFHFKHFFENSNYSNSLLNYCSLDYSFGYDTNRQQSHEFDFNFLLEITRHFLLKGNLRTLNGDDLEETQAAFSLIYRW